MTTVSNFKELERLLNKKINTALNNEVNKVARNTLKEHIVEDVYESYSPTQYERTGGMLQDRNIESHVDKNNTLTVRSTREEDGRDIAKIIETGDGYTWEDSRISGVPRPFHEKTTNELANGKAKKALEDGLRKQGVNIK